MKFILILILLFASVTVFAEEKQKTGDDSEWITIPAGAKSAYMGINGGTMPISLMVQNDGSALLSFVGKTGNDFLEILRKGNFFLPSLGNATLNGKTSNSIALFAGNSTSTLPVYVSTFSTGADLIKQYAPFGFSSAPLSIEGMPTMPKSITGVKKYPEFILPGSLTLRKKP